MAETEAVAPAAATTPKKTKGSKAAKPKKPKADKTHPKVSEMVNTAIGELKEKGGSSLQAIKKYISGHYKVDMERLSPFIRKYLKNAVVSGALQQTKGKGASGSFKISGAKSEKPKKSAESKPKKPKAALKKATVKKAAATKKPAAKKAKKPTKAASPKKTKAAKPKAAKAKKPKSPAKKASKAKK